jgi:hypothetical protein
VAKTSQLLFLNKTILKVPIDIVVPVAKKILAGHPFLQKYTYF